MTGRPPLGGVSRLAFVLWLQLGEGRVPAPELFRRCRTLRLSGWSAGHPTEGEVSSALGELEAGGWIRPAGGWWERVP